MRSVHQSRVLCVMSFAALLAANACSGSSPASGQPNNPGAGDPSSQGSDAGASPNGGDAGASSSTSGPLKIPSLTSTTSLLTGNPQTGETDAITFVAIVTDDKGLDNIAGGQLLDDAGTTYAAFGSGSTKGTYTASVDWDAINKGNAINFSDGQGSRNFVAKFFDNDGNVASATLKIGMTCRADAGLVGACGGVCVDTQTAPADCGACGSACAKGLACGAGTCSPVPIVAGGDGGWTACVLPDTMTFGTTCNDICAATSLTSCDSWNEGNPTCSDDFNDGGECTQVVVGYEDYAFHCHCY